MQYPCAGALIVARAVAMVRIFSRHAFCLNLFLYHCFNDLWSCLSEFCLMSAGVGDTGIFQRDQTLNVLYCIVIISEPCNSRVPVRSLGHVLLEWFEYLADMLFA